MRSKRIAAVFAKSNRCNSFLALFARHFSGLEKELQYCTRFGGTGPRSLVLLHRADAKRLGQARGQGVEQAGPTLQRPDQALGTATPDTPLPHRPPLSILLLPF